MLIHGSLRWPESSPTGALRPRSLLLLAGVGRSQASSNEPRRGEAAEKTARLQTKRAEQKQGGEQA